MRTTRKINRAGLALIKAHESLRLRVYRDPVGIPTVGWGHVVLPNDALRLGDTITHARAKDLLARDVAIAEQAVDRLAPVPLTSNEFSALVSFVFNVGAEKFKSSTLRRKLLDHRPATETAKEFSRWVYAKGRKLRGLIARRQEEKELFLTPDSDSDARAEDADKHIALAESAPLPEEIIQSRLDSEPIQASKGSLKSWMSSVVGWITGAGAGVVALVKDNQTLLIGAIGLIAIAGICVYVRQVVLDYARIRVASDPTKIKAE